MTLRYNNKGALRVKCAHHYFSSTAFLDTFIALKQT